MADALRHADHRRGGALGGPAGLGRVRGWAQRRLNRHRPADGAPLGGEAGQTRANSQVLMMPPFRE